MIRSGAPYQNACTYVIHAYPSSYMHRCNIPNVIHMMLDQVGEKKIMPKSYMKKLFLPYSQRTSNNNSM